MSDATLHLAPARPATRPTSTGRLPASPLGARSAIVLLTLLLGLTLSGSALLGDPDTQWHIAVGRDIWATRAVPTTDLYSHTFAGAPWIAKEWLSQLILFAADAAGGWRGVVLMTALAIGSAFAILHEWLQRRLDPVAALVATLAALVLAMPHFLARPHMLVLPVIVAWMVGLATAVERGRAPRLWLALAMALWANMHGSFPLGLVMAGLLALDAVRGAPRPERRARLLEWAVFLVVATAATTLSPYGWHAILVPLQMEGNGETLKYVSEWKHLQFDALGIMALATLALSLAALLRVWRANVFRIVALAALGAMMVQHVRFVSLFGVLDPILVAPALVRFPRLAADRDAAGEAQRPFWGVAAMLAIALLVAIVRAQPTPDAKVTPDAAYRAAVAAGVHGPVYNDYDFGGYLIAHGMKTFVDGRTDQLFLGDFMPSLVRDLDAKSDDGFARLLARYHVTWALVRTRSREARHLATMPGWTRVHTDDVASVFKLQP